MTIRLTDLDQDDQTPIEQMRDPIGVLLVEEGGWAAACVKTGYAESGSGSPSGLPGTTGWVTNCSFEQVKGLKMTVGRSDLRLRTSDWFKPDLEEMLEDALRRYVAHVVRNALAWGIEEVEEVQQLIDWCRDEGPDFHLVAGREELRALLEDPSVAGFAKIDVLREDLFEAEPDARG